MRKLLYPLIAIIITILIGTFYNSCRFDKVEKPNVMTETNKEVIETQTASTQEWQVLFDGSNFDQWRGYLSDSMPETWSIKDGAMVFTPEDKRGQNIISKDMYYNFELSLEWNIAEGGNSGIFWGVIEDPAYPETYQSGPEIQVLDNAKHPDAAVGEGTHTAGALYDMIAPSKDHTKPAGNWNHCLLRIDHRVNQGRVFMNGHKIIEFSPDGPTWDAMVADSKFADWPIFGKSPKGHIGLQDHGDSVAYRNIKIKHLLD